MTRNVSKKVKFTKSEKVYKGGGKWTDIYKAYITNSRVYVWKDKIVTRFLYPQEQATFTRPPLKFYYVPGRGEERYLKHNTAIENFLLEKLQTKPEEFDVYDKKDFRVGILKDERRGIIPW